MAVLTTLGAGLLLVGCYSPALPDCAVPCHDDGDCAPSQRCGDDGLCIGPDHAGGCANVRPNDATVVDANIDARPLPPDAPRCTFTVAIAGKGKVVIDGTVECSHMDSDDDCSFDLPMSAHQLVAIPQPGEEFDRWTSVACHAQNETCHLAHCTATTPIGVKFVRDD